MTRDDDASCKCSLHERESVWLPIQFWFSTANVAYFWWLRVLARALEVTMTNRVKKNLNSFSFPTKALTSINNIHNNISHRKPAKQASEREGVNKHLDSSTTTKCWPWAGAATQLHSHATKVLNRCHSVSQCPYHVSFFFVLTRSSFWRCMHTKDICVCFYHIWKTCNSSLPLYTTQRNTCFMPILVLKSIKITSFCIYLMFLSQLVLYHLYKENYGMRWGNWCLILRLRKNHATVYQ